MNSHQDGVDSGESEKGEREGKGGEEAAMKDDESFRSQMTLDVFKSPFCFSSPLSHPVCPVLS